MFGYVRPFRPYLRVCENEGYKSIYCGLCKSIGREFGLLPRFTLSYDLTFLAIMDMSVNGIELKAKRQLCIAHPLTKRSCAGCSRSTDYSAYVSIMLVYHKLMDDISDGSLKQRLRARAALPFIRGHYHKAIKRYPQLAAKLEKAMKLQLSLEKQEDISIDRACEPTARMMQAVFAGMTDDEQKSRILGRMGFFLGKYIYLADALDDLRDDVKAGRYNPLIKEKRTKPLTDAEFDEIAVNTRFIVNMMLGQLASAYIKLDIKMYSGITDNIIYLGLPDVISRICSGTFSNFYRPGKDGKE
ncbi:MAG: hypothetical protein IKO44_00650 [Ruminococcus sp.]|nr:hypothetical protein [Ruminococcus sp.]